MQAFGAMLRYLDSQVGRPMSLTRAENLHKEPDDIITYVFLDVSLSVCLSVCLCFCLFVCLSAVQSCDHYQLYREKKNSRQHTTSLREGSSLALGQTKSRMKKFGRKTWLKKL